VEEPEASLGDTAWRDSVDSNWLKFDDSSVYATRMADLWSDGLGGGGNSGASDYGYSSDDNYGKSAYMLVYERKSKKEIREVI